MVVVVSERLTSSQRVTAGVGVCGRAAGTKFDSLARPVRPTLWVAGFMGGWLRWLWLSGSPPLIFLLCVLLSVESVYGK